MGSVACSFLYVDPPSSIASHVEQAFKIASACGRWFGWTKGWGSRGAEEPSCEI